MALSAPSTKSMKGPTNDWQYPLAASQTIFAGALIMLDSAGYAREAVALASNQGCVGWATENVDNSAGSAGDLNVTVQTGRRRMTAVGATQADVGGAAFASDDETVSSTQATNEPAAGTVKRFISSTELEIYVGP